MKEIALVLSFVITFSVIAMFFIDRIDNNIAEVINAVSDEKRIIVLDAGHGGEDGGCVAFDGTEEKSINLRIVNDIAALFDIFGIDYVFTRTDDNSIGDLSLPTIRKRKNSDIMKRYEIVNSYDNSILLSIHQNMFPVEKYYGTQVFYSAAFSEAEELASEIQNTVKFNLQTDNMRKIKPSDSSIYLLYNAKRPSVMVECGFMSNLNELTLLKDNVYQKQIAYFITKGLYRFLLSKKDV